MKKFYVFLGIQWGILLVFMLSMIYTGRNSTNPYKELANMMMFLMFGGFMNCINGLVNGFLIKKGETIDLFMPLVISVTCYGLITSLLFIITGFEVVPETVIIFFGFVPAVLVMIIIITTFLGKIIRNIFSS